MNKNIIKIIAILSAALSPLFGSLIGQIVVASNLLWLSYIGEDILINLSIVAWLVATLLFYKSFASN